MKSLRFMLLALSVFVLGVALTAFRTQTNTTTVTVVEHADTDVVAETGAEGDSVGDVLTFANPVFNDKNDTQIGTDQGYCLRTEVGKSWECNWTLILDAGQITVEGPFLDAGDSVLAITGGTGEYAGARGQMTLHSRNDAGSEFDFVYEIIQ